MKLAFIVSMFFEFGGMQRTLLRTALVCASRGHDVHLFAGELRGEMPDGVTFHEVDTRAITNHGSNKKLAAQLRKLVAGGDYDCIVGFTKLHGLDVYYAADPCFAARVHEELYPLMQLLPRYREMLRQERAVFDPAGNTEILLINHAEREKFIHYYNTPPERFHLLPPGIARDRMASPESESMRNEFRTEFQIGEDDQLLLLIGSNFQLKGLDRAIEAVRSLPPDLRSRVRLFSIGADEPEKFIKMARKHQLDNQIRIFPGRKDIHRFLAGSDLLLHPARKENTGTVILEAMVSGLPVLVSGACGYHRHVEKADAGVVLPEPFSQENMNNKLAYMLGSQNLQNWSSNGINYGKTEDLYSLIEKAADIIINRAIANRENS